jgi:hypothetical protein
MAKLKESEFGGSEGLVKDESKPTPAEQLMLMYETDPADETSGIGLGGKPG